MGVKMTFLVDFFGTIFLFFFVAQDIDCGYMLEQMRRFYRVPTIYVLEKKIRNKTAYPCKPQFYYIKLGYEGI